MPSIESDHYWSQFIELLISKTLNRKPNITHTKMFVNSTLTGSHLGFSHTQHLTSSTTNTITKWMSKTFQISNKNIDIVQCTLQSSNIQKLITSSSFVISLDSVFGYISYIFFRMNHPKALNELEFKANTKISVVAFGCRVSSNSSLQPLLIPETPLLFQ